MINFSIASLFKPQGCYSTPWNGNIVLLTVRNNPGKDIYFTGRFSLQRIKTVYVDEPLDQLNATINAGDFVVILRTVPPIYLRALLEVSSRLAGVAWFIDDDIPDAWRDRHLPKDYARRLSWSYLKVRSLLTMLCDRIWVSTQWLASKYSLPNDCILTPAAHQVEVSPTSIQYFYHGTKAHWREIQFLYPIVAAIQEQFPFAQFEIFGDHEIYKLFRNLPRTRILHTMKWDQFKHYTASTHLDIGFAPILASNFNRGRSHNKLLDITRCGAIGIYSEYHSNAQRIAESGAGLVINNDPQSWIEAFEQLLTTNRTEMLIQAQQLIRTLQGQSDLEMMIEGCVTTAESDKS